MEETDAIKYCEENIGKINAITQAIQREDWHHRPRRDRLIKVRFVLEILDICGFHYGDTTTEVELSEKHMIEVSDFILDDANWKIFQSPIFEWKRKDRNQREAFEWVSRGASGKGAFMMRLKSLAKVVGHDVVTKRVRQDQVRVSKHHLRELINIQDMLEQQNKVDDEELKNDE